MIGLDPATRAANFAGSFPRSSVDVAAWHGKMQFEDILDPGQPLIDAHHHIFGDAGDRNHYRIADYAADLASGHNVIATIYVEAYHSSWRASGPEELKPIGEVEAIVARTTEPLVLPTGQCQVAAGIVAFADLTLGERVEAVLDGLAEAARGRLSGIRQRAAVTSGVIGRTIAAPPVEHLLSMPSFREGMKCLSRRGLPFDVWIYHEQLPELIALADEFPGMHFVLNHVGAPIGIAETQHRLDDMRRCWIRDLRALAERPNVCVKIGGMGMTMFGFAFEERPSPPSSLDVAEAWRPNFEICIEAFGPERCMFETNFPVDQQSASYAVVWNAFKRLAQPLSEPERQDLFRGSALRTYRLPAPAGLA